MDDHLHLHEGETLLCSLQPSVAVMLGAILRSILEGGVMAIFFCVVFLVVGTGLEIGLWLALAGFGGTALLLSLRRVQLWRHASLRVTTERLLFQYAWTLPEADHGKILRDGPGRFGIADLLFGGSLKTVKWAQYQESEVTERAGAADVIFRSRMLKIRYGTADAQRELLYPSVPFAHDLKHYLDKVDSAVRRSAIAELRPFVAKPRGQRDA